VGTSDPFGVSSISIFRAFEAGVSAGKRHLLVSLPADSGSFSAAGRYGKRTDHYNDEKKKKKPTLKLIQERKSQT